jgi:YebC/PmpR family DNA-binding regulatory protein
MSGHSKWSSIKHQKGVTDAKRGQLFTKLTREIIAATREGGGSPDGNFRLRLVIQKARDSNMPMDNIQRAIQKGSGGGEGVNMVELVLGGRGPGGAVILVQALTDNRNRTVQEVRNLFSRAGGNLGDSSSVAWLFESKGIITVKTNDPNSEDLALQAIDAGAEDVKVEKDVVEIYTLPDKLEAVRKELEKQKVPVESAQLAMLSKTLVSLDEKVSLQTLKLLDKLEELDEVQNVTANVDFSDDVLDKYQSGVQT